MDKEFLKFIVDNYHDELNSKDILRLKMMFNSTCQQLL